MALNAIKTLATASLLALASSASAGVSPFTMVSGVSAPNVDVTLELKNASDPYAYDFVITNNSQAGIITGVYLEEDWNSKISGAGLSTGPAILSPASLNPDIPGWEGPMVSHTVDNTRVRTRRGRGYVDTYTDDIHEGILPGQTQTFSFVTDTSIISLNDMMAMVGMPGFGVGIRVQNLGNDPYASAYGLAEPMSEAEPIRDGGDDEGPKVTGAPTPTAAFGALVMAGIAGMRRRRG